MLAPLATLLFNPLKTTAENGTNPLGVPTSPAWSNFATAWERGNTP